MQTIPHRTHTISFCASDFTHAHLNLCESSQKSFFHRSCRCSTPATSPSLPTGIRLNPCATSLRNGLSGRLPGPIPNTGYEPKFCIDVDSEHTPINLPSPNMEYDATIAAFEDLDFLRQSVAPSSSQLSASVGTCSRKLVADYGAVVSRTCIKETCADMDRETVVSKGEERSIKIKTLCKR